jgi:hypothetical protein
LLAIGRSIRPFRVGIRAVTQFASCLVVREVFKIKMHPRAEEQFGWASREGETRERRSKTDKELNYPSYISRFINVSFIKNVI